MLWVGRDAQACQWLLCGCEEGAQGVCGGGVIKRMPEIYWFYTFKGFCEGGCSPQTPNQHRPTCTFSCSRPTKKPAPDTDPEHSVDLVGAYVGKLSLGGSDGGGGPGWGMAIGEIWHTSRLWVSIDFIYSDAKL